MTGRTLAALKTPSASGPVSAVFGEHWAAYSYWSGVNGRAEIGSIELGDGSGPKVGFWDAVVGTLDNPEPYSSFDGGRVLVAAQTYFGPKSLAGMGVTRTRNGIASKVRGGE